MIGDGLFASKSRLNEDAISTLCGYVAGEMLPRICSTIVLTLVIKYTYESDRGAFDLIALRSYLTLTGE
jgi:hypothetical protein